jgi:hypothetical protein
MKRKEFILSRNGEYIGWFDTREQAEAAKAKAVADVEKYAHDGWITADQARQYQFYISNR